MMAEASSFKCPNCGAGIFYDGKTAKMVCEYCSSEIDAEEYFANDKFKSQGDKSDDFNTDFKDKNWNDEESEGFSVHTCPTCGGQLITDANTAATKCIYCGNPATISERLHGVYRPELVIPFKTSKEDAVASLNKLYRGKWLLPKLFKDKNKVESVKGVYLPFWLFSCDTDSNVTYTAKRITTWSDMRYHYTKTDHYRLYRSGKMTFTKIPADGSLKTDDTLMESIEPFGLENAVPFEPVYLSGFYADKYDVEPSGCRERINERILNSVCDTLIRGGTGFYTGVMKESSDIKYTKSDVSYALLPVWLLITEYKGKKYTFAMNGETGKAVGELPVDYGRFFALLGGFTAALTAIFTLILTLI